MIGAKNCDRASLLILFPFPTPTGRCEVGFIHVCFSTSNFQFENVRHGALCYMLGATCGCASHVACGAMMWCMVPWFHTPLTIAWAVAAVAARYRRAPLKARPRPARARRVHARRACAAVERQPPPLDPNSHSRLGTSPVTFGRRCQARGAGGTLGKGKGPKHGRAK